ncbi:carboxymuconolactone decarboxylase family protein [Microbacterium sp. MAHUQ-60]|uniref:carboxymuconolactone decarboxylase family protein n=1 Tax=unclassified Microbacterium TaxID=2609290 RepID=UPI0036202AC9
MFGDDLVDRNYIGADDFNRPVQQWLAGAVWADVWTRDGLDRRTRSLVTIAILAALRSEELEMHLTAAPRNGCTVSDIQEVLLQVAPYCGAPAALAAFRRAESVLTRLGMLDDDEPAARKDADHGLRHE